MIRFLLFIWPVLLALPVSAQDSGTMSLGELKLDLNELRSWGVKVYSYQASRPGQTEQTIVGTMTLKTVVEPDRIILDDQGELAFRGEEISLKLKHVCEKNSFMSPVRIESVGKGSDEIGTFVVTVDGTEATVDRNGEERQFTLPEDTVTPWAFMRLVTLLPREKGSVVRFEHWMESSELNQKEDFRVESLGTEVLKHGDSQIACTRFRLAGTGIPSYYWVDCDGILRQILMDERKLIRLKDEDAD